MLVKFQNWITYPKFAGDEDKTRTAALLNSIIWIFILASGIYCLLSPINPKELFRWAVVVIPFMIIMLILKQLVNLGYLHITGYLIVFTLWLALTYGMSFGADYKNPAFMGYIIVVICAGLILNWRSAIGWGIFSVLTNTIILRLGQIGILPLTDVNMSSIAYWLTQILYILTTTFLIGQALSKIEEANTSMKKELAERKQVEKEREAIIKELEARNAELERFTYSVSHDLKSPLITIGGFVSLLEEDAQSGNTEKFHRDLEHIRNAKDKMQRLLNELLELSRIGRITNPPSHVPFSEIIKEAIMLTKGRLLVVNATVQIQDNLPVISGDRPRLVEVMQNLIDNAAKFSSDQPEPHIEIGVRKENHETVFFVKDNGIGIDPKFHQQIFDLFKKLDSLSDGTGVGLTLVKRIIEVHGGRIWVESDGIGKGSTFCFTLPT